MCAHANYLNGGVHPSSVCLLRDRARGLAELQRKRLLRLAPMSSPVPDHDNRCFRSRKVNEPTDITSCPELPILPPVQTRSGSSRLPFSSTGGWMWSSITQGILWPCVPLTRHPIMAWQPVLDSNLIGSAGVAGFLRTNLCSSASSQRRKDRLFIDTRNSEVLDSLSL